MTALVAVVLSIALFCWWLSGNWYAWAVAFAVTFLGAVLGFGGIPLFGFPEGALLALLNVAGTGAVAWALTGVPYWLRKRRGRVTIIAPSSARWPRSPD